jgi:type I restriction enzyme S subunit
MGRVETKFKETEIGLVPWDWEVKNYGEIFYFLNTAAYSRDELSDNDEIGYIHYGDIHTRWEFHLKVSQNQLPTIPKQKLKNYSLIKDGDLIMADASEDYKGIGKSVEIKNIGNQKVISGLHTFLFRDLNGFFINGYKGYLHSIAIVKKQFDELATGMKVYGISKNNLKKVKIPFSLNKTEQTAIANALSDVDGYIESLEKLIDKKQKIKQGAMQQLLKPQPHWVVKKLGEVCKFQNGTALESYFNKEDGYKVISIGNYSEKGIFNETGNFIAKDRYENVKKFILEKGDLAFLMNDKTAIGTIIGRVLFIEESDKYIFNQRTMRLVTVDKLVNPKFLFHLINSDHYHALFVKSAKPGTQIYLNTRDVLDFEIIIPTSEEQEQIAKTLTDIDSEIANLNQKLTKAKHLKQGMMQQLLTGKIRLL